MEELRSALADRFVLTLINKKMVSGKDFEKKENQAVLLKESARKLILVEWQKKKKEVITHPFLKEKVEWGWSRLFRGCSLPVICAEIWRNIHRFCGNEGFLCWF